MINKLKDMFKKLMSENEIDVEKAKEIIKPISISSDKEIDMNNVPILEPKKKDE